MKHAARMSILVVFVWIACQMAPPTTTTVITTPATTTTVAIDQVSTEFIQLINDERARVGLGGLAVDSDLAGYALAWSVDMAATRELKHSDIASLLGPWGIVGENVGSGVSVDAIWGALLNSPLHYANIVDPRFTHLGVGAIVSSTGVIWTVHVYAG